MYPRCSPGWVVSNHPKDQLANLPRRRSSSNLPPDSGDQLPVHTKTSPVPAGDGFGRNDDEGFLPSRPDPPSNDPKELIEEAEARARMPPFQYRELLSEREILQNKISATAEKTNQAPSQRRSRLNMAGSYTRSTIGSIGCKLLILRSARVLTRHTDDLALIVRMFARRRRGTGLIGVSGLMDEIPIVPLLPRLIRKTAWELLRSCGIRCAQVAAEILLVCARGRRLIPASACRSASTCAAHFLGERLLQQESAVPAQLCAARRSNF